MEPAAIKILILEHDPNDLELLQYALKKTALPYVSEVVQTREAFIKTIQDFGPDIILSDFSLPTFDGLSAFKIKQELCTNTPFIIVSGTIGEENAVDLIKQGVTDYVLKERLYQIGPKITRAIKEAEESRKKELAEKEVARKRKQLKASYKQTRNLLESISEGFFAANKNWTVTYWNHAAERLLLTPKEKILGKNLWDVFEAAVHTRFFEEYHRVITEQVPITFDEYFAPLDRWYEVTAAPANDGLTGFFRDVTEMKLAQEKIKHNEKRFRALLQNSTDGLTLLSADGTVIERTPSAIKILELDFSEESGKFRLDLVHPDDLSAIANACEAVKMQPEQAQLIEYRMLMPAGNYKWIEANVNNQLGNPAVNAIVINFRDITERKLAELALRKHTIMLNKGEEMAKLGSWYEEINTGIGYWSEETFRIFGLMPGEIVPSKEAYFSFIHPEDLPEVEKIIAQSFAYHNGVAMHHRIIRKDGEIRNVYLESKFDSNHNTKEDILFGVLQDVTEQKKAEENLRKSEARLKEAQAIGKIGNWEISYATGKSEWSDEIYRIFGVEKESVEPAAETFTSFIHPEDLELVTNTVNSTKEKLMPGSAEFRFFRPDGEARYGYSDWRYKIDKLGNPTSIFGILQDITDKKLAELALEQSEAKYRSLFELSPIPMWVFDVETYQFLHVNEAAVRHYGYNHDEFLSMTIKDIRPSEDIGTLETTVQTNARSGIFHFGNTEHILKSGDIIQVEIQSNLIDYEGRKARIVLARDISERLRYIEAIEDQNEKLREIAWIQSHVVRAPLARIMGLTALLKSNHVPDSNTLELLNYLVDSANELDGVIKNIVKETENLQKIA
ncbi:PAS domain S-box protein [Adhaeribacter terreus]|uniref:histidine kinase n=1 Tax=Adhaeribacter terreus TaxID=529703 RepID=A0ABW0EE66_9BACT